MSEQLYRWVKASERMPEKEHNYHVRATSKFQGYDHNDTALFRNGKFEFVQEKGQWVTEWLEPLPSPGDNQSLEDAAQEYIDANSEWALDQNHFRVSRSFVNNLVRDAFLAGAAYVKGGEEK